LKSRKKDKIIPPVKSLSGEGKAIWGKKYVSGNLKPRSRSERGQVKKRRRPEDKKEVLL